jgi:predicted RNase H-like nuclease
MSSPHCITTYRGISFDVCNPAAESILAEDIAHALSLMCRAGGHFVRFYSVAQHAINCCREAHARGLSERLQLAALLHDASEAYIADITRPVKALLPEYIRIENILEQKIFDKFGIGDLSKDERDRVREIDNAMLAAEFRVLHAAGWPGDAPDMKATLDFAYREMAEVESEFLRALRNLLGGKKQSLPDYTAIGIDGCKGGWIAVIADSHGNTTTKLLRDINETMGMRADVFLVDIPIGFIDGGKDERIGDKLARKMLGKPRNTSVFPAPCRSAVYANSYSEAIAFTRIATGKSLSALSWAIVPKIREVDEFLREQPHMRDRLRESHPELCFAALKGKACAHYKKESEGVAERKAVLNRYIDTEELLALNPFKKKDAGIDDILDAAALAVIGLLGLTHGFRTLPENPPTDSAGLTMQMTLANLRDNAM